MKFISKIIVLSLFTFAFGASQSHAASSCSTVLVSGSDFPILPRILVPEHESTVEGLSSDLRGLRQQTSWQKLSAPAKVGWNWIHSTLHNFKGVFAVVDLMALRKMPDRLISDDHPWVTGISPVTGKPIWPDNIVFASPRSESTSDAPKDAQIATTLGRFLSSMVKRSTPLEEIPQGPRRRMPHAVNYIHGTVHFNGVFMIFNDFKDAMFYFTDPKFVKEFRRLAGAERREITIVFRNRDYKEYEYAFFMGFIRSHIPWYANGNGPKKKVFYGAMSGFPAVNTINGSWIRDMYDLKAHRSERLVRPPVSQGMYFQDQYQGHRVTFNMMDRALAQINYWIVKKRGAQGGMVFTPRERIEPEAVEQYKLTKSIDAGVDWKMPSLAEEMSKDLAEPIELQ